MEKKIFRLWGGHIARNGNHYIKELDDTRMFKNGELFTGQKDCLIYKDGKVIIVDIVQALRREDWEELKTKTSYNSHFGKFRDGTDMIEYTNKLIERREHK